MSRLPVVVEECVFDWRENPQQAARIIELAVRYKKGRKQRYESLKEARLC